MGNSDEMTITIHTHTDEDGKVRPELIEWPNETPYPPDILKKAGVNGEIKVVIDDTREMQILRILSEIDDLGTPSVQELMLSILRQVLLQTQQK